MEAFSKGVNHAPPLSTHVIMACTVSSSVKYNKCDNVDWTQPALDVVQERALVNMAMKLSFYTRR
jgi:hypothetical protein